MISLLLPTRNRPDNLQRLIDSALKTAEGKIEVVVYIDEDDHSYDKVAIPGEIVTGPRIVLSEMWNKCFEKATGDILMHCGDDIVFQTPGWDTIVKNEISKYPDNIVFVFGNDGSGVHDGNFGTHGFIHRKWVETVGYFVPPYFSSDYNDTWLNDVAQIIGRKAHIDILTEHLHFAFGKGEKDQTHEERLARHARDKVDDLYYSDEMTKKRFEDAEKLKAVMNV